MKKIFEKVVTITLGVISLFFVIMMLVTAFGGLELSDFDNSIVRALLICLAVIFAVLTGLAVFAAFQDNEKLSSVVLFKNKESATKATVAVVKRTAKRVVKEIPEAKLTKVQIVADDNGNVRLKVDVKLATDATMEVVTKVRALLIDTFANVFGIEFASIDFRIVKSKNSYVPSAAAVDQRVAELKATVEINKPEEVAEAAEAEAAEAPAEIAEDTIGIIPSGGDAEVDEASGSDAPVANSANAAEEPAAEAEEAEEASEEEAAEEGEEAAEEAATEEAEAPVTEAAEETAVDADEEDK
ncbi:MAG: hypothetical protein IAB16_00435 [Firmicutes bacterium]|uniref:Alkaline shock response membrane anchor protein AmaP n=1 Tax=Candidatus Stercoripulliclostridium pullicola TaxID=2840953 RepID=A0A940DFH5_9FIRM|nr:hypothetical protein [Candidatus Stercoripulliclostridium pullicola]